jgi:hypothetical protein
MSGYDISCDPGDLYSRKCYVNVHDPPGCDPAVPPCTVTQQEIISYTGSGDPISKAPSTSSWIAWVPTLNTLNMSGVSYQPYGDAGLPYASGAITTGAGLSNPSGDSGSGSTDMSDTSATGTGTGSEEESKVAPAVAAVGALALIGATIKYGWATDIMAKLRK